MLTFSNPATFRRTLAALCCFAAPLALLVALLIHPGQADGLVGTVAAHPDRTQAASLLIIASSVLFVPALLGALQLVRHRGAVLGHLGVALAVTGVIGHAVFAGFQIVLVGALAGGVDRGQLTAMTEGTPNVGFLVVMAMFMVGFFPGVVLLAVALWRGRAVPVWASLALLAFVVSDFVPVGGAWAEAVGPVLGLIGFATVGVTLLRMADPEWAGPAPVTARDDTATAEL